jgi:hypothetical protein
VLLVTAAIYAELVESFDQERAAAARQVENAETLQRFLPGFSTPQAVIARPCR